MVMKAHLLVITLCSTKNTHTRCDIQNNQNGTMAKDALLMEKTISAECVHKIAWLCELFGLAACVSSPISNHTLIGQLDLATANG